MNSHPHKPDCFIEVFLQPGEFYFGDRETRIRTLLGSCVAITLWHPGLRIGGMCHYMLPMRHGNHRRTGLDGRYADDAIALFMRELENTGSRPADYEVKMFGGGDQFTVRAPVAPIHVSDGNIDVGRHLLKQNGFKVKAEHLGGTGHRNVIFDVWSGQAWIQHVA
jgi:chemotaxis protein CheD